MIERIYGWGSGAVYLPRPKQRSGRAPQLPRTRLCTDLMRHVLHDIPWRTLAGSSILTVAAILTLFALHTQLPALNTESSPVPIAVRFLEMPADPELLLRAEVQKPPALPESDEPLPKRAPTLPPPVEDRVDVSPPPTPSTREDAPPAPVVGKIRPAEKEMIEVGPLPDLTPPSTRDGKDELPASGTVTLASSSGRDPALAKTGLTSERYSDRRSEATLSEPVRRERIDLQRVSDHGALPVSGLPSLRERSAIETSLPESNTVFRRTAMPASEVIPAASSSPIGQEPPNSAAALPVTNGASFEIFERESPPDLDRTRLVSLTELRTCLDPLSESELRTRLATLLSRPVTCRSGGVFFEFHQPESAWSIRVDIYNYEGATFRDRCSALQRAVECSEHGRRNPQ